MTNAKLKVKKMAALELTSAALSIALLMFRFPTDWKSWYKNTIVVGFTQ